MKYLNKFLSLTLIISLFGCGSGTDTPKDNTESPYFEPIEGYDETYIIEPGTSSGDIEMQYVANFFTPNEEREVMLFGNDGNETWNYAKLEINGYIFSNNIGRGLNSHRDGDIFTVPIKIKENNFSNDETNPTKGNISIDGSGGTSSFSSSALFIKIENREFIFHYSCMTNCDIFGSEGDNTLENATRAFGEAHTDLIMVNENLSLSNTVLDIRGQTEAEERQLLAEQRYSLSGMNFEDWENNEVWVFGCSDYLANILYFFDVTGGARLGEKQISSSFIFCDRETNYASGNSLVKQERTSRTIHELGHARGMRLNENYGYITSLTSDHIKGHNGKNKGTCLMRVPGNQEDPRYTSNLYRMTLEEPKFCSGHIQMLLNCIYLEGDE